MLVVAMLLAEKLIPPPVFVIAPRATVELPELREIVLNPVDSVVLPIISVWFPPARTSVPPLSVKAPEFDNFESLTAE
jgi:hypothetical protein